MRYKDKLLTLIVLAAMFITMLPVGTGAVIEDMVLEENTAYTKLVAIGIIDPDDNIIYEDYVGRDRFVQYMLKLCGLSSIRAKNIENPFSDVTEYDDCYEDVLTAYSLGIISKSDNFRPKDYIKPAEAAKILAFILGYGEMGEAEGGYPTGYLQVAARLRLLPTGDSEGITPSELFRILIKALQTELLQVETISIYGGRARYSYNQDEKATLLGSIHNLGYAIGVIEANEYTSIYGEGEVQAGAVLISETSYLAGNTKAKKLLGQCVEVYYDRNPDPCTLLYAEEYSVKNTVTVVDSHQINTDAVTTEYFEFQNQNTGRSEKYRLPKTVSLIYNGGQTKIEKDKLCPEVGEVMLIDNNGDGNIDVISVMDYRTVQVSAISSSKYVINDSLGGENIILDPKDISYGIIIEKDGNEISFADISEKDVISYAESAGSKKILKQLVVSSKVASGSVSAIDKTNKTVEIGQTAYHLSKATSETLNLGMTGTFYLDYAGRIVTWTGEDMMVYGYLNELGTAEGLEGGYKAQIFTEYDRWVILKLSERIRFNGVSEKTENALGAYIGSPDNYRQLIRYSVNMEGVIIAIDTALEEGIDFTLGSDEEKRLIEAGTFRLSRKSTQESFRTPTNSFGGKIGLLADTKIFMIPKQTAAEPADLSEFSIKTRSDLLGDTNYSNISVYDANIVGMTKVCVLVGNNTAVVSHSTTIMVCGGVSEMINHEGEIVPAIQLFYGTELVSIPASDNSIITSSGVEMGDIVQCSFNNAGSINSISVRYDLSKGTQQKFLVNSIYTTSTLVAGRICSIDRNNRMLSFDHGASIQYILSTSDISGGVYVYNIKNNIMEKVDFTQIAEDDYCFLRTSYFRIRDIILYQ